ncbi:MAG TPA: hypothetical protein VF800_02905 [Telluria sp.]|jgi:hypothetical protein
MDTTELKRLAEAATPGPWIAKFERWVIPAGHADRNIGGSTNPMRDFEDYAHQICATSCKYLPVRDNAAYIAAANPTVVLALIARVAELEASAGANDLRSIILASRAEGRAEAVQIIIGMDAEDALGDLTGWSSPVSPDDEGSAYWDMDKLREVFSTDDKLYDAFAKAEEMYWDYRGIAMEMQWEAEQRLAIASVAPPDPEYEVDPMDVVRALVRTADQMAELPDNERALHPSPTAKESPLMIAARNACVERGFTAGGLEIDAPNKGGAV